ncbi:MAG: hypothetical protein HYR55_05985 [Acidobacteria bacterium]|nr:hypothetical protein [Acidobacteriota bacterium]
MKKPNNQLLGGNKMIDYSNEIAVFWPTIMKAWHEHKDKRPLIECNLLERSVYTYPAKEYINTLSERTRLKTLRQYTQVVAHGGMMVFIIDPERRVLQSYIYSANDIEPQKKPKKTTKGISKKKVEFVLEKK